MDYKCDICEKHFKSKNYLLKHSITKHMKTLTCKSCQLSYQHLPDNFNCNSCVERGKLCKWCKRRLPSNSFDGISSLCNCCKKKKHHKKKKITMFDLSSNIKIKNNNSEYITGAILSNKNKIEAFLNNTLIKMYPASIKYSIIIDVEMKRGFDDKTIFSNPFFRVGPFIKHQNNIEIDYAYISELIENKISTYTTNGSGWVFVRVNNIYIEAVKYVCISECNSNDVEVL